MGIALKVGEKIPLFLLTENRVTNRVVRARVRDALGAEISGSPFTVPHLADGEYFNDSELMPNTPHLIVTYDVFDVHSNVTCRPRSEILLLSASQITFQLVSETPRLI